MWFRMLLIIASLGVFPGCFWSSLLTNPEETNYALLARSSDRLINDGQYETIGSTLEGKPRVFVLQFPESIHVHKIAIENYNLFRFDIDFWDAKRTEWKTLRTVKQRRDATGEERTAQPKFLFSNLNVVTDKLRLAVSRTVDDTVIPKSHVTKEDKVIAVETSSVYALGYYYRVFVPAMAQMREIQVFGSPVSP